MGFLLISTCLMRHSSFIAVFLLLRPQQHEEEHNAFVSRG